MKWPAHKGALHLTHNPHKSNYETVEEYMVIREFDETDWVSPEQRAAAIAGDTLWELQWYPNTPVGFNIVCGADLDAVLAFALSQETEENAS